MVDPLNPVWLTVAFTVLVQFCVFLRWLHRRLRDEEMQRAFLHDMATHHLPHMYHALRLIATHLHIAIDEPPQLRFTESNENYPRRR